MKSPKNTTPLHFENIVESVTISPESTVSRTLSADENAKSIVFGFDAGQELSEHTASVPAVIHILSGEADISLGEEKHAANAGS